MSLREWELHWKSVWAKKYLERAIASDERFWRLLKMLTRDDLCSLSELPSVFEFPFLSRLAVGALSPYTCRQE